MDTTAQVEAELNALTERRAKEAGERERWDASARRYAAQLQAAARREWGLYHAHMARLHAGLAREHRAKAKAFLGREGDAADEAPQAG